MEPRRILAVLLLIPALAVATPALDQTRLLQNGNGEVLLGLGRHGADASPWGATAVAYGEFNSNSSIPNLIHVYEAPVRGLPGSTRDFEVPFLYDAADVAYDLDAHLNYFELETDSFDLLSLETTPPTPLASGAVPRSGPTGGVLNLVDFFLGRDGRQHAVIQERAFVTGSGTFQYWRHWGVWDGHTWTWYEPDAPFAGETAAAGVGPDSNLYLLITRSSTQQEFSQDLYFVQCYQNSRIAEGTVRSATESDWFYGEADLDFLPDGRPVAVGRVIKTVATGSPTYYKLDYYERQSGGTWTRTEIASTNDGYRGTDGNNYTGGDARIVVDEGGVIHVAFQDASVWHEGGFARAVAGQWRVTQKRPGGAWQTTRLIAQPGMTQSRNPLHILEFEGFTVSPGGSHLDLFGVRVEASNPPSHINPPTYSAVEETHWHAIDPQGSDATHAAGVVADAILGRLVVPQRQFLNFDRNGDGVVEAADLAPTD